MLYIAVHSKYDKKILLSVESDHPAICLCQRFPLHKWLMTLGPVQLFSITTN